MVKHKTRQEQRTYACPGMPELRGKGTWSLDSNESSSENNSEDTGEKTVNGIEFYFWFGHP